MKKIKISAVSYLNTLPLLYGLELDEELSSQIEISKDIPSDCAKKLLSNEVDLGLIPVAVIPELKESHIISDYCIGAVGKVKSVLLLSDVPLEDIEDIYLDHHSRTSVKLCQLLCKEHWRINPNFLKSDIGFEEKIEGKIAGVLIGDRTFNLKKNYAYQFDLAEEWQKMTGLPFVFAAWVSNKKLPSEFIEQFNKSLSTGVNNIELVVKNVADQTISKLELLDYFNENISYELDEEKRIALDLFLKSLS